MSGDLLGAKLWLNYDHIWIILYYTILYRIVLYYTTLYYTILYCSAFVYTILYYPPLALRDLRDNGCVTVWGEK